MKILMSIHNKYVKQIKSGEKKFEFRKTIPKLFIGDNLEMLIYATAPVSKVVGIAKIKQVHVASPSEIWELTKDSQNFSLADKEGYDDYYQNKAFAVAYEIAKYVEFEQPKTLAEFGLKAAPQSFAYVK